VIAGDRLKKIHLRLFATRVIFSGTWKGEVSKNDRSGVAMISRVWRRHRKNRKDEVESERSLIRVGEIPLLFARVDAA